MCAGLVLLTTRVFRVHTPRGGGGLHAGCGGTSGSMSLLGCPPDWRRAGLLHCRRGVQVRFVRGYERQDSSRATCRNGTIRYTAIPQYSTTATSGKTSPMRIAITYPITTGRSFLAGPGPHRRSFRRLLAAS